MSLKTNVIGNDATIRNSFSHFEKLSAALQYTTFRITKNRARNETRSITKDPAWECAQKLDACAQAFRANPDERDLPHLRYRFKALAKGLRTNPLETP